MKVGSGVEVEVGLRGGRGGVTVTMTKIYHMHYETLKELIKNIFFEERRCVPSPPLDTVLSFDCC